MPADQVDGGPIAVDAEELVHLPAVARTVPAVMPEPPTG